MGVWTTLPDMPVPRQEAGMALLRGQIYVVAGLAPSASAAVHAFDLMTGMWATKQSLPVTSDHPNVAAVGDRLYFLGPSASGQVLEYNPDTNMWTPRGANPGSTTRKASAVAAIGAKIYIAGGYGVGAAFTAYDTATDTWETLPNMPEGRDHLAGVAIETIFYALAGRRGGFTGVMNRVDAFDTVTKVWSVGKSMITARAGHAATVSRGLIVVMGGEGNQAAGSMGVFPEAEVYNPMTNTWRMLTPMKTPRHGIGAVAIDGKIYVPGGATRQGSGPGGHHFEMLVL